MTTTAEAAFDFKIGPDGLPIFEPETVTMDSTDPFAQEGAPGVIALQLDPNVTIHQEGGEVFARRGSTYVALPPGLVVGRAFNGEHAENSVGLLWEVLNPYVIGSDGDVLPIISGNDLQSPQGYAFQQRTFEGSQHFADFKADGEYIDGEYSVPPQHQDTTPFDWFAESHPTTQAEEPFDWFGTKQPEEFNWFDATTPAPEATAIPDSHISQSVGTLLAAAQVLGYRPATLADLENAAAQQYFPSQN